MRRILPRAAATFAAGMTLVSVVGLAQPAMAKPVDLNAPAPVLLDCFGDFGDPTIPNMTEPDVAVNYAGEAGCVGVRVSATSQQLAWVVLADGWSYTVKSDGGGTASKVFLQFANDTTNQKINFRFEFGKVVIG
jgi:hypothetical protein